MTLLRILGLQVTDHEFRALLSARRSDANTLERRAAETRARVQQKLVKLVDDQGSESAAKLLAIARALDTQAARWNRTSQRLEQDVEQVKQRSLAREAELQAELGQMQVRAHRSPTALAPLTVLRAALDGLGSPSITPWTRAF